MHNDEVLVVRPVKTYGGALAAVLAAGIGAFTMGVLVIANEIGVFVAPTLYGSPGRSCWLLWR
jgi:hypothetical protein